MSKNLNENQLLAVQLVAQGKSGKEIAKELSVTEETISRWKKQPAFIALVNEILGQLRDTTQQKMRNLVLLALEILEKELFNENSLVQLQKKTCFMIASLALLIKIFDYSRLA